MTRIIAGSAGGRHLRTPSGERTRPTSDRVREALFSSIESEFGSLEGVRFLDVYAGSGAVGIEAASRGAGAVSLVESHKPTARLIADNARSVGLEVTVMASTALSAVAVPGGWDIVFLDPPYDLGPELDEVLATLARSGALAPDAVVIVERSRRSVEPSWPEGWEVRRRKKYGETVLWYVHASPNAG